MEEETSKLGPFIEDLQLYSEVVYGLQEQNPDKDCFCLAEYDMSDEFDRQEYEKNFGKMTEEEKKRQGWIFTKIKSRDDYGIMVLGIFQLVDKRENTQQL